MPPRGLRRRTRRALGLVPEEERLTQIWESRVFSGVRPRDQLAAGLRGEFQRQWHEKVFSLQEFGGSKSADEVAFSPLEQQLFDLLRLARRQNPLFTDRDRPLPERDFEFANYLFHGGPLPAGAAENTREQYQSAFSALERWLDNEYQQNVSKGMIIKNQAENRAIDIFHSARYAALNRHQIGLREKPAIETGKLVSAGIDKLM